MKKEKKQEQAKEQEQDSEKKHGNGFGLRLSMAIILTLSTIAVFASFAAGGFDIEGAFGHIFPIIIGVSAFLTILQYIATFQGKKHKWANVISIVVGSLFVISWGLGLLAILGGINGNKTIEEAKLAQIEAAAQASAQESAPPSSNADAQTDGVISKEDTTRTEARKRLFDFPVDYENKPAVSQFLDLDNRENIFLENENGEKFEFHQIYVTVYNEILYALAETVGLDEDELVLFRIDYASDLFHVEHDEAVCQNVYDEYKAAVNAQNEHEKQQIKRSEFKLDLYDANIDERTWKNFKKTASQEELAIIAIGAKYRIAHGRILNMIYALGIVLSIALLWPTGFYSLIAYPVFAFLATKAIRYEDTYSQAYRKLNKENKAFVDSYYNCNIGLTIVDLLIKLAVFWLTIPYQALLMIIGMFAPNFVISKNGILVSIPKGYDVGNLGAVGAYYSSFSFIDESLDSMANSASKPKTATYKDQYGNTTELTETAQVGVYSDKYGTQQYVSDDGGKTVRKKD